MAKRMTYEDIKAFHLEHPGYEKWMYPWNEWLDGSWWLIKQGEDYFIKTKSMRKLIYDKKLKWGGPIYTRCVTEDSILLKRETDVSIT